MDEELKPQYINTDFVLESENDLTAIAKSFGEEVFVLYCEKIGGCFRARFEMPGLSECPDRVIQHFSTLISSLEESEKELYDHCFFGISISDMKEDWNRGHTWMIFERERLSRWQRSGRQFG